MTSFDYNYQNPSVFIFLMLIKAIFIQTPLGFQNLNNKVSTISGGIFGEVLHTVEAR